MKSYEISSPQNETFKLFKSLLTSHGVVEHGQALLFGRKSVPETLRHHPSVCVGRIVSNEMVEISSPGENENLTRYILTPKLFLELDVFGSRAPILLVKTSSVEAWSAAEAPNGCILYLPFQDPGNVGTVLRSAAAFNVSAVILGEGAANPFHPRSSRAASGSLFSHRFFKARKNLDAGGIPLVGLDKGGRDFTQYEFPEKFIIVPGAEGPGLQREVDVTLSIPMSDKVESLNAAVAVGIVLQRIFAR